MADRIPRPCTVWPCDQPASRTGKGKCTEHARQVEAERNTRRARSLAVYRSARWRRLRARVLRDRPWCEHPGCRLAATDVDHITRIEDGGDPWDEDNLQPLCHAHHSEKTRREQLGRE